jgi:hypothetical protein
VQKHRNIPSCERYYFDFDAEQKDMYIAERITTKQKRAIANDLINLKGAVTYGEFVKLSMNAGMSEAAAKRYHAKLVKAGELSKIDDKQYKLI